jgi:hypothetical protein
MNRLIPESFEDSLRVGAIGLVARHIGSDCQRTWKSGPG